MRIRELARHWEQNAKGQLLSLIHIYNGDGRIDAADAVFDKLRLLRFDAQGRQRLQTLGEAGVSAIDLRARDVSIALGAYDQIAQLGRFEFTDGRSGQAADLLLAKR